MFSNQPSNHLPKSQENLATLTAKIAALEKQVAELKSHDQRNRQAPDLSRYSAEVTCASKSMLYRQSCFYKNSQGNFEMRRPAPARNLVSHFAPIPSNLLNIKCYKELLERRGKKVRALGGNIDQKYRLQEHDVSTGFFSPTMAFRN